MNADIGSAEALHPAGSAKPTPSRTLVVPSILPDPLLRFYSHGPHERSDNPPLWRRSARCRPSCRAARGYCNRANKFVNRSTPLLRRCGPSSQSFRAPEPRPHRTGGSDPEAWIETVVRVGVRVRWHRGLVWGHGLARHGPPSPMRPTRRGHHQPVATERSRLYPVRVPPSSAGMWSSVFISAFEARRE